MLTPGVAQPQIRDVDELLALEQRRRDQGWPAHGSSRATARQLGPIHAGSSGSTRQHRSLTRPGRSSRIQPTHTHKRGTDAAIEDSSHSRTDKIGIITTRQWSRTNALEDTESERISTISC